MQVPPLWQTTPSCPAPALAGALLGSFLLLACGGIGAERITPHADGGSADSDDAAITAEDFDGDGMPDPRSTVIEASGDVRRALCSDDYESAALSYDQITRGSWQFNPGGGYVELPEPGYPCRAFLYDTIRPSPVDERWTDATDRDFVGFSEISTIQAAGYMTAQFRYFRTLIYVPEGRRPSALTVRASGIDDALYLAVYNSAHPEGLSPLGAGPEDAEVGACHGNGNASWDLAEHVAPGEVNVLLLVHADMSPATSSLASVEVEADGQPIQMVSCAEN